MECGNCTLCCKMLYIKALDKKAGEWCKYCNIGVGCEIYGEHPEECKIFECAYYQVECSESLRPDKCRIIFEKISNEIFIGSINENDSSLTNDAKGQIFAFLKQGFSVVLFSGNRKPVVHVAEGHDKDYILEIVNERRKELEK